MKEKEEIKDPFERLIALCIKSFAVTFNDTIALDANGVIGKQRVLILDSERYQRETRKLKAKRTIDDLSDIDGLMQGMDDSDEKEEASYSEEEEVEEEEEAVPEEEPSVDFADDYDIRDPDSAKKLIERKKKEAAKVITVEKRPVGRPAGNKVRKYFDKAKVEMRLKLLQNRRDILDSNKGEEEKETDALNIFFIPVTKEEFEKLSTVEVFEGAGNDDAFAGTEGDAKKDAALGTGLTRKTKELVKSGSGFHYEDVGGEQIVVED
jgi:hypothetical protein